MIAAIFAVEKYHGLIRYNDIKDAFSTLGICDYKTPKGQLNQQHLNYDVLDFCSIRIINRMIHHLGEHAIPFS